MMVITAGYPKQNERSGSWHTGETMYVPKGRVVTFQADGHELYWLLDAIEKAGVKVVWDSEHLTPIF